MWTHVHRMWPGVGKLRRPQPETYLPNGNEPTCHKTWSSAPAAASVFPSLSSAGRRPSAKELLSANPELESRRLKAKAWPLEAGCRVRVSG